MADTKSCPLCGDDMQLTVRETTTRIPGSGQTTTHVVREWTCPGCDYWEESESNEG